MIFTPLNIFERSRRVQTGKPTMACLENQIWFNKPASELLNAPSSFVFEINDLGFFIIRNDDGFSLRIANNRGCAINSRPMIRKMQKLFKTEKPKFLIRPTIEKTIFKLELINL